MDENIAEGDDPDLDIIQLLNTKKKNRDILSITNAAVDAVSSRKHVKTKTPVQTDKNCEETKENIDCSINSVLNSNTSSSSKDVSFNGRHRVRVPSRLLREIKSPLERSKLADENSSTVAGSASSSSLFTSQSSSRQSSIQATGPVPTVIKYSSDPPWQHDDDVLVTNPKQDSSHHHRSPVVIKYTQHYASGGLKTTDNKDRHKKPSTNTMRREDHVSQHIPVKHSDEDSVVILQEVKYSTKVAHDTQFDTEMGDTKEYLPADSCGEANDPKAAQRSTSEAQVFLTGKTKEIRGTGLCQGAPSSNIIHMAGSAKGQVKAVSFSSSDREKATREILSKRQEHKAAVRRVVQPRLVPEETMKESQVELKQSKVSTDSTQENIPVSASSGSSVAVVQLPSSLEKQMSNLMNTLDAIETKCQQSRIWQEQRQQELENSLKQRDERRLQNLEDMQRQLFECQLKYVHSIPSVVPYPVPSTSSFSGTTQGLSTTQSLPATQVRHGGENPGLPEAFVERTSKNLDQGVSSGLPQYSPAVEHKTQPSFKTAVYNKPQDVKVQSGLKRKFVRNKRSQTSPQYSSSTSSSDMTSPLETPLPRKRPPIPMSRMSRNDHESSRKHVHFDTPNTGNPKKLSKERDQQPATKATVDPTTVGVPTRTTYQASLQDIERFDTSRPESSNYLVNDIGKLRQELKDALKETEKTKLSLKNLHDNINAQISDDDILALPDHTQPYPLDAYLRATRDIPEESDSTKEEEVQFTAVPSEKSEKSHQAGHYADAVCILRDVQRRKETLESNLISLTRQHEEQHLYRLVDDLSNEGPTSEALRIRKDVAKKIEEIAFVVQSEIQEEERQRKTSEKDAAVEARKSTKFGTRSTRGMPLSTERRAKIRNTAGKENQPRGGKSEAKSKKTITKPVARQPVMKRPLEDFSYVSRVYGRQDHVPRRSTLKSSNTRHQSPVASSKQTTAARDNPNYRKRWDDSISSLSDDDRPQPQHRERKPRYYFQPSLNPQVAMKSHLKDVEVPVSGQLLPMAIPLGKPKTDPSLRLPVDTEQGTVEPSLVKPQAVSSLVKQPNVAVITIRDDGFLDKDDERGKRSKPRKTKGKLTLDRQVLPNVDIDSSSVSEVSESPSVKITGPQIMPWHDPLPRPGPSEYEEFKDYEGVRDVQEMEGERDDDEKSVHDEASVISLHGISETRKPSYQGPAFPPQNIPAEVCDRDGFQGTILDDKTIGETLEDKAVEWIEKELLARVVSEMVPPRPDPTSTIHRSSSPSVTDSDITDPNTEPDLLAAIGLRGIQLFVDAGIPVDNDLVRNLIVEVLREKVSSLIGYPKPQAEPSPQEKEEPADDYTEPDSLSDECTPVKTPVRTPSEASVPPSQPASHVPTPERTSSPEYSSSLLIGDDITTKLTAGSAKEEDNEIEEGPLDDTVHGSPVPTPIATPTTSPPQSTAILPTPENSEQELRESERTGVETPEITVSVRDKSSESPQELEEDLKEQTFVEDSVEEEENDKPEMPAVKLLVEPKPSEVTNSPSSITTTTYSTQSTMGTVATEDEISEGEQLQPLVHVGQYSEGEFAAPSAMVVGPDHLTTMQEIPDDIFDSFNNTEKNHDVFKHAVSGLLRVEERQDETCGTTDESSSSDARNGVQGSMQEEISRSEGEVPLDHDVVATLLQNIRRLPSRKPRKTAAGQGTGIYGSPSVGELLEKDDSSIFWHRLPKMVSAGDVSPGELSGRNENQTLDGQRPEQSMDRPQGSSVFDSDENNNDSEQSNVLSDVQNQSRDTKDIVTAKKIPSLMKPSNIKQSESRTTTDFPRVLQVTEARQENTPTGSFLIGQPRESTPGNQNVTMETTDIETGSLDGQMVAQPTRIELTLPSHDASGSASVSEEPLVLDLDDTGADASSLSGGEISGFEVSGGEIT